LKSSLNSQVIAEYLYSFARLFLIRRIDDMKYMPMISDKKRTTLVVDPVPTLETAKKNCTGMRHDSITLGSMTRGTMTTAGSLFK
jgi:hypothetical protein